MSLVLFLLTQSCRCDTDVPKAWLATAEHDLRNQNLLHAYFPFRHGFLARQGLALRVRLIPDCSWAGFEFSAQHRFVIWIPRNCNNFFITPLDLIKSQPSLWPKHTLFCNTIEHKFTSSFFTITQNKNVQSYFNDKPEAFQTSNHQATSATKATTQRAIFADCLLCPTKNPSFPGGNQ